MFDFIANQDVTAFVTHVGFEDCSCSAYAQIGDTAATADCLADTIEQYISNAEHEGSTQQWKEGDICLAQFHEDCIWYRARILRKSGLLLSVFFIDYGNSDTISVDCARKIPETLLTTPPLATTCIISGCTPSGSAWSDMEIEKHRKTLENTEFKAKIMSVDKSGKDTVLAIQLFQTDTGVPLFYTKVSGEANSQNAGIALRNLEIGNIYNVFISHVESACKFWVQLTEHGRELSSLMSDIAACFADDSPSSGDIVDPKAGQICATCYSEDGCFYRGMVNSVINGACNVIFIDYGNSETKPSNELFTLPQPLCKLPAQAIHCSYHGSIDPSAVVNELYELAAGENVIMRVVSKANDVYYVQIPSIEKSLNLLETVSDPQEAGLKSDGQVWVSYSPLCLQVGSVYDVCISCVDHPGCFFIQLIGNGPKIDELLQSLDKVTHNSPVTSNCYKGLPCLANFSDGVWYRAEVVSVDEENVQVAAVDFGFIEEFKQSQLRDIDDNFRQLPAQSVQCTVDVSRTDKSCWSRKDCDILTELTDKSALVAKVVAKKDSVYQLDLYETDKNKKERHLNAEFSNASSGQTEQKSTNASSPVTSPVKSHQAFSPIKEMPRVPPPEFGAGVQVEVCVTAVQFPHVFGQITSTPVERVAKLQSDLNTFYEKIKVEPLPQNGRQIVPGTFCCAQYSDNGWYRAMVTGLQGGQIEVTFVDFGDLAIKSPQSLYILKSEFCKLAQQCIKCRIKNLPSDMTQRKMEDILVTQRLDVKLLTQEDAVYPEFEVELPNTPVNRKLLDKLYEGQKRLSPRESGRNSRQFGGEPSGSDVEGYTHQKVRIGTTENVMVTHINDPEHFHCVLDGMSPSLELTMDHLHEHYNKLEPGQEAFSDPVLGTPCVAQYSADKGWYRAKITGLLSNGLAEVMFVDYGNNECLSKDLLKAMKPEFLNLPAQAILCGLADVSSSQGFWSPEHIAQFEDLVLEQSFQATFRSQVIAGDQPYKVTLVSKKGEEINRIFGRSTDSLCADMTSSSKRTFSTNNDKIHVKVQSDDWGDDSGGSSGFGSGGGRSYDDSRFGRGGGRGSRSSGFDKGGDRDNFGKGGSGQVSSRGSRGGFGQNRNEDEGGGFGKTDRFSQDHKEGHFNRRHDRDGRGGFGGAGFSRDSNKNRTGDIWAASDDSAGRDRGGLTKVGLGNKGGSDDSSSDSSGFGSGRRQFGQRSDGDSGGRGFGNKGRRSYDDDSRSSGFRNDRFGRQSDDREANNGDGGGFRRGDHFSGKRGGSFGGERRGGFRGDKGGGRFSQGGDGDNQESGRGFGGRRGFGEKSEGGFGGKSGEGFGGKSVGGFGRKSGGGFGGKSGGGFGGKSGGGFVGTSSVEGGFGATSSGGDDWDSEVTEPKSQPQGFGVSTGGGAGGLFKTRGSGSRTSSEESWEGGGNTTVCAMKITAHRQRFSNVSSKEEEAYVNYKLKLMETADVYVVYTDSPSKFWCQAVKNSTDLQNLMDEMNEEYEKDNLSMELQLKEPKPGMPCAAKFSDDNMWYRGEIKKCSTSEEEVHFVDYGNTETVCLSNIRKLKPKFLYLPTQGLKCGLDKVSPSGGQWTDEAIEEFENLTADRKHFLKVLNTSADSSHMVVLENHEENIDIAQALVDKGHCTVPTDTVAKKIISSPYPSCNLPLGTTADVYVSWIENPHKFWCQPVSEEKTLDKLAETLQEQYNLGTGANLTVQSATPGMAVVSLFSEDGSWYRAVVEAVAGDRVQVQFVDYGNTDTVKLESLRRVTEDLLQIHCLAAVCRLTGIRPLQSGWTVDAKDIMKQLVEDKTVSCKVLDKEDDCLLVKLMVKGTNMGEELIRAAVVRADKESSPVIGSVMLESEVIYTRQGIKRYPASSSLKIGSSYSGYVAYVESVSSFWCQLVSSSDELDTLMQNLSHCNSISESFDKLEVGSACVARYSEDQAWYRGRVDKVDSDGVTVFFVDYGSEEVISPSDVCAIQDEFLTLPTQAIHCSLQLSSIKSNQDMSKKLQELLMDQELTIKPVKVNNDVYEIILTLQDGTCVNDIFTSTAEKEVSTDSASKGAMIRYPKASYPTDKNIKVYLSYMESPSKFYVHLASQEDELNELMGKLKDRYSDEMQSLSQGMSGLACIAKFSDDGEWYRAEVLESHDTTLKLLFVDYGNCEETSLDIVKILASEFVDIQPLALQCCIQGLDPIGEEWSSEAITEFEALTFDKELTCNFYSLGRVKLQSEDGNIGEMLVNSGHAKWRTSDDQICILDKRELSESSEERLQLVREGGLASKEELVQQQESEEANENDAIEESEGDAETELIFLSDESQLRIISLEEGQRQTVIMSHCESPSLFWIQLESNKSSLDTLLNSMYEAYNDKTSATLCVDKVQEGDIVVALYAEDESWYRAKVLSVASDQEVEVLFMDYGNSEFVLKDSLKKFMVQFSELPIQGLKCCLSGVNPKVDSWSDEAIELFTELTRDKLLLMDVLNVQDQVYQVQLMNMGLSIGQQLLDQGDAVDKETVPVFNKRVHRLFASDSSTPNKPQKEQQFRYQELVLSPKSGLFEVLFCHLTNPGDFWCQKLDYQKGFAEFDTQIQDSYSSDSETITDIETYLACVVLNSEDSKYYRGVVQKVNDKSVIVLCIDNGYEIQVPSENVKKLKSEFMELPQQAFHCGLSDITSESLNGTWDASACSRFDELVYNKPVKAELTRCGRQGKHLLKLYDGDVSIAQALVDGGYARFRGVLPIVDKGEYKQLRLEVDDEYEVTLVDNDEMDKLVFHVTSQAEVITGIIERVAETIKEMEKTETELNEGDLCLVLNKSSDTWYRGVIQGKENEEYEVYTLDYGSLMTVEAAQVLHLSKSLMSIPAQAIICSLDDIIPEQDTTWTEESMDFFKDYCTEGRLLLYVSSYEDEVHHVVLSKEGAKGSVNALLVDLGFATAIPGSDIDLEVQEEQGEESFMEISLYRLNSLGSTNEEETTTDLEESLDVSMFKSDVSDDCILSESAVSFTPSEEDADSNLKQKCSQMFSSKLEASTPNNQKKRHVGELNSEEAVDVSSCPLEQEYCQTEDVASTVQDTTDGKVILISSNQNYTEGSNGLDSDQPFIQMDIVVEEPELETIDIDSHHTKPDVNVNVSSIQEQLNYIVLTGSKGCIEVEDVLLAKEIKAVGKEVFIDLTNIGSYVEIRADSDDATTCMEVCESYVMLNKTAYSGNELDESLKTTAGNARGEIEYSVDGNKENDQTGVEEADIFAKENELSTTGFDEVKSKMLTERKDDFQHENEHLSFTDNVEDSVMESDLDLSYQYHIYRSPTGYTTSELDTTELAEVETDTEEKSSFVENGQETTGVTESDSEITAFTDYSIDTTGLSELSFDQDLTDSRQMENESDFTGLDSIDGDLDMTDTTTEEDKGEDESDKGESSDGTTGADRWKDGKGDLCRSDLVSNLSSQDTVENSDEYESAATDQDSITDCSLEVADQRVTTNRSRECYGEDTVEKSMWDSVDEISHQIETADYEGMKDMTRNKEFAEDLGMSESSSDSSATDSDEVANSYLCKKATYEGRGTSDESNTLTETREIYIPEEDEEENVVACDTTDHGTVVHVCIEHADSQIHGQIRSNAEECDILAVESKSGSIEISTRIIPVMENLSDIYTQSYDSESALQRSPTSGYIAGESQSNMGVEPTDVSSCESFFTAEVAEEDLVGDLSQGNIDSDDNTACHRDSFFVCENCRHEFSSTLDTTGCSSEFSFHVCESCQSTATTEESSVRSSLGDYIGMKGGLAKGGNLLAEYSPTVYVDEVFATSSPTVELAEVDFFEKDFDEGLMQSCEDKTETTDSKIDVDGITESELKEQVNSEKRSSSDDDNNNNSISQDTARETLFEEVESPVDKIEQSVQNRIEASLHNFEKYAQSFLPSEPELKDPDTSTKSNDADLKKTGIKMMKSDTVSTNVDGVADLSEADKIDVSIQSQELAKSSDTNTPSNEPEEKFDSNIQAALSDISHDTSILSTDKVHETDAGTQLNVKEGSSKSGQDSDTVKTEGYEEYLDQDVTKDHKSEFPECRAGTDVCSHEPKCAQQQEDTVEQAGDSVMQVELNVEEFQDNIQELDNDGQKPVDSVLMEDVAAIDDKAANEGDTEKESKDASEKDICDQSKSKGTEDNGNRMEFVDVCPGIELQKAKVQEKPGITNKEKKEEEEFEDTLPAASQNETKSDETQSTETELDRVESSESWFDAKEG